MNKQEIIKEIKHRLELYKTLKPEEFYFGDFVTEYNKENHCGTICCLWGWEPRLTGVVKWEYKTLLGKHSINYSALSILDWGYDFVMYLYYPVIQPIADKVGIKLTSNSSLPEVLSAWEKVIELLETGDSLDQFLNLR